MLSHQELTNRIFGSKTSVSFYEFVTSILHDPDYGYYGRGRKHPGIYRDFYTAPELTNAFGICISKFIISQLRFFPANEKLAIIEIGSGRGMLMQDIADNLLQAGITEERLELVLIEQNISFINEAKQRLSHIKFPITFFSNLDELPFFDSAVVICNELFDALPFSRIRLNSGAPSEIFVKIEGETIHEIEKEISEEKVEKIYNRWFSDLTGSGEVEIAPGFDIVLNRISKSINKGVMLIIDYGDLAHRLYAEQDPHPTMRCYRNHKVSDDPYEFLGEQDVTCSVNFSELIYEAIISGFSIADFTDSRSFFIRWGILEQLSALAGNGRLDIEKYNEIQKIKNLVLPSGMGDIFKVLLLEKGIREDGLIY
ncbi:MAG: SAM-dependent methyltransferase [Candidatus Schekmanbacteria bacterium]|nr:SAM-dependent methyltransferase [Candidatus Schekmanbacteria bacterium]